jgi:hypothetical protein
VKIFIWLQVLIILFLLANYAYAQNKEHPKLICTCGTPAFVIEKGIVYDALTYREDFVDMLKRACKKKVNFIDMDVFETRIATKQVCPIGI